MKKATGGVCTLPMAKPKTGLPQTGSLVRTLRVMTKTSKTGTMKYQCTAGGANSKLCSDKKNL